MINPDRFQYKSGERYISCKKAYWNFKNYLNSFKLFRSYHKILFSILLISILFCSIEIDQASAQEIRFEGWDKLGEQYDNVRSPVFFEGKIAFIAEKDGKTLIVHGGKVEETKYLSIRSLTNVGGKLAYIATKEGHSYDIDTGGGFMKKVPKEFIVIDGQEIGLEYDKIEKIGSIGDKLFYSASLENKLYNIYKGQKIGKQYKYFSTKFIDIGGELAYRASNGMNKWFVVYDGVEFGNEYDSTGFPYETNGKLTYTAEKEGKVFIVFAGNEIGNKYDVAENAKVVGGKLAFEAVKDGKRFIIYNGEKIGRQFDKAMNPFDIGGKLAYLAESNGKSFFVYDGEEIGKQYNQVGSPMDIGGKLAYLAEKGGKWFVIHDGKEIGSQYDKIGNLMDIEGKPTFTGEKNGMSVIFRDGNEIMIKNITSPLQVLGDKLIFSVENDGIELFFFKKFNPNTAKIQTTGEVLISPGGTSKVPVNFIFKTLLFIVFVMAAAILFIKKREILSKILGRKSDKSDMDLPDSVKAVDEQKSSPDKDIKKEPRIPAKEINEKKVEKKGKTDRELEKKIIQAYKKYYQKIGKKPTYEDIGKEVGISKEEVSMYVKRLNARRISKDQEKKIIGIYREYHKKGKKPTYKEVGEKLDISEEDVKMILKRLSDKRNLQILEKKITKIYKDYYKQGKKPQYKDIGEKLNISEEKVRLIVKGMRMKQKS